MVTFDGRNLKQMKDEERANLRLSEFGFVFQQPYLLGYLTALENVVIAAGPHGRGSQEQAQDLLETLGMGAKQPRHPHELSVGERQRVCVARALLGSPKAIFADEPTASLDHTNGVQVVELLNKHRGEGSLVMVTHDPRIGKQADKIIKLRDGEVV